MDTILYVTRTGISDIGSGGKHRSYQVAHDLEAVGTEQIFTISLPQWWESQSRVARGLNRRSKKWGLDKLKLRLSLENPYNLFAFTPYTTKQFVPAKFYVDYEKRLRTLQRPLVCVLDDTRLAKVVKINTSHRIPTVFCIQNLESFDTSNIDTKRKWAITATAVDFANELWSLSQANERLFISRVETGLISGLGLSAHYYPYLPVGLIRQRLEQVRQQRLALSQEAGLFLLLGNARHKTTKASMAWFVKQAQRQGLPKDYRVVVGGDQTDELLLPCSRVPGLELRGWLRQADLDRLLLQVKGVLVPQPRGFGALTRLPELACAGIPVITSQHATYAIDVTPGLHLADDDWPSWCEKMVQLNANDIHVSQADYSTWEKNQPQPLATIVKELLKVQ